MWVLVLMVHGEETLSLAHPAEGLHRQGRHHFSLVMGILSQQTLSAGLQDDAARNGIYVVNPTDLPDITTQIRNAAAKQKQIQAAATAPLPAAKPAREPAPAS